MERARLSPRQPAEPQEKAEYVADLAGSNMASFCGWHGGTGHRRHCTHEMSLPLSMSSVWVTAGVPRPTVTTYSKLSSEVPSLVGKVTSPRFATMEVTMPAARTRSRRSTSAGEGTFSDDGDGEHGPCRWFSGSQARPPENGMLAVCFKKKDTELFKNAALASSFKKHSN